MKVFLGDPLWLALYEFFFTQVALIMYVYDLRNWNVMKYLCWVQNSKVDPKNEPNFYTFLVRSFPPFKKFFLTGLLKTILYRKAFTEVVCVIFCYHHHLTFEQQTINIVHVNKYINCQNSAMTWNLN
jgi:hypothetical protein